MLASWREPATTQASTPLPTRNLDVLRAVAVLSVVGDHVAQLWTQRLGPLSVHELGRLGVLLFFVHTALVLMSSLERQGEGGRWIQSFYVRRAFRIYPLAIVTTLAWLGFGIPSFVGAIAHPNVFVPFSTRDILASLALVQNLVGAREPNSVIWSLPLEVQMYLALPVCYLVARRGQTGVVVLLGAAVAAWTAGTMLHVPGFWRLSVLTYTPCFLAGVLAYSILRRARSSPHLRAAGWPLILVAAVVLAGVLHVWRYVASEWIVCLVVGASIPLFRDLGETVVTKAAHVVCEYSYGIYLTHYAAIWLAFVVCHALPLWGQISLFLASAVALAAVSYHAIERPCIAVGKRAGARLTACAPEPRSDGLSRTVA